MSLKAIESKIFTLEAFISFQKESLPNQSIVFTNGCFDIVHKGHLSYLSEAKDLGDFLVIGLNTDDSVQRLKGPNRPIKDETTRALLLASLFFVDAVILFNESTPINLIEAITPNILVKGADYEINQVVGAEHVINNGGKVALLDFIEGHSTTKLVTKMKES